MDNRKIVNVTPLAGSHRLHLEWDDGNERIVDLEPTIANIKGLNPLKELTLFSKVAILETGWVIGWPGNLDFAADNLWEIAQDWTLDKGTPHLLNKIIV